LTGDGGLGFHKLQNSLEIKGDRAFKVSNIETLMGWRFEMPNFLDLPLKEVLHLPGTS